MNRRLFILKSLLASIPGFAWLGGKAEAAPKMAVDWEADKDYQRIVRLKDGSIIELGNSWEEVARKYELEIAELRKYAVKWIQAGDFPTGDLSRLVIICFSDGNRGTFQASAVLSYAMSGQASYWAEFPHGPNYETAVRGPTGDGGLGMFHEYACRKTIET